MRNWATEDVETLQDQTRLQDRSRQRNPRSRIVIARMLIVDQHKGDVTLKTKGPIVGGVTVHVYIITGHVISASVNYNCISNAPGLLQSSYRVSIDPDVIRRVPPQS